MNSTNKEIKVSPYKNNDYFGEIFTNGPFTSEITRHMIVEKKMTTEAVEQIVSNMVQTFNNFPNPVYHSEFSKTGIIIGKVQSGKTSNFLTLLSLAFDNGFNIGIILGGITVDLLQQNIERIKESFAKLKESQKLVILDTKNSKIDRKEIKKFISQNRKIIIISLKSPQVKSTQHMSIISSLFDDPVLNKEPTIIIDDEGDQATLNSRKYSKNNPKSQTYKVAIDIKNKLKRHCFISVTATPQANILIETIDNLSPEFCQLIFPGKGYCGLSVFHGENNDKYIKIIPEDKSAQPIGEKDIWSVKSFKESLATFFVGNAIRKHRGENPIHSMLIHPSEKKDVHARVSEKINDVLADWKIRAKDKNDHAYLPLEEELQKAYDLFIREEVKTDTFENLEKIILDCIDNCSDVFVVNSDEKNNKNNSENYRTRIYLGGNIMGRGMTIEGLAVTYITRRAKNKSNVDTTEQRARWFGYKSGYIDVCRVWATSKIKNDYTEILDIENKMWKKLMKYNSAGKPLKELKRALENSSENLNLTRNSVQKTKKIRLSGWIEQKHYINDKEKALELKNTLETFFEHKNFKDLAFDEINHHRLYSNINVKEFKEFFLDKFQFDEKQDVKIQTLMTELNELIKNRTINDELDVVVMRVDNITKRKIDSTGTIPWLFRGADVNNEGLHADKTTCEESPGKIHIQVHYVQPSNEDWEGEKFDSPVLAAHIPEKYKTIYEISVEHDK